MKKIITLIRLLTHAPLLAICATSLSAQALNVPTHYGCSDMWSDPEGSATNALAPKGFEGANKIHIVNVTESAADAAVTLVYSYSGSTQQLPSAELELLGARIDGASVMTSIVYPLQFFNANGSYRFAEKTLTFGKPSPGDYRFIAQIPNGCALGATAAVLRSGGNSQWILRVAGPRPTVIVSTLTYLPTTRNFMTASLTDVQALRTAPGLGASFALLEDNFRAWPVTGDAPANAVPVCRFFRASTITHAYSANASECASLRVNPQWADEGIAFRALVPASGTCASGTEPIYKLTNAMLGDTQRYTRSEMTYRTLALNGWTQQGVAFCSPVG
jgi:hypothetical protein